MHYIELPKRFWKYQDARCLPAGELIQEKARTVLIRCGDTELKEIETTANHYAAPNSSTTPTLGTSARRTLSAIRKHLATPRPRPDAISIAADLLRIADDLATLRDAPAKLDENEFRKIDGEISRAIDALHESVNGDVI